MSEIIQAEIEQNQEDQSTRIVVQFAYSMDCRALGEAIALSQSQKG